MYKIKNNDSIIKNINHILHSLGFFSCYLGYSYLVEIIYMSLEKELNKERFNLSETIKYISTKYNVSSTSVKSSVRNIIKQSWNKHNTIPWKNIMNIELTEQPTVKEVVFLIEEHLYYTFVLQNVHKKY